MASFLGGKNQANLEDDAGPWNDYEIVDGANKDDVVGVKKIGEPDAPVFSMKDLASLPNYMLPDDVEQPQA